MTATAVLRVPEGLDTLVRGLYGSTDKEATMRVTFISPFGWVGGITADGTQHIMYPGGFKVIGPPRPIRQRGDIPARLRHDSGGPPERRTWPE